MLKMLRSILSYPTFKQGLTVSNSIFAHLFLFRSTTRHFVSLVQTSTLPCRVRYTKMDEIDVLKDVLQF